MAGAPRAAPSITFRCTKALLPVFVWPFIARTSPSSGTRNLPYAAHATTSAGEPPAAFAHRSSISS